MSGKITSGDPSFRRNYLRSIIEGVEVDDKVIRIHGSKSALEQAVTNGDSVGKGVRGFIRKWRAKRDKGENLIRWVLVNNSHFKSKD